jgi:hypothetical protein
MVWLRSASNLPLGSVLTINISDFIGEGSRSEKSIYLGLLPLVLVPSLRAISCIVPMVSHVDRT